MAGLFGLFGKKSNDNGSADAFYLDSDDAKTFGDIEYMRKQQQVKKTFPKIAGIQPVKVSDSLTKAAMEMSKPSSNGSSTSSFSSSSSSSSFSTPTSGTQRRRPDMNLDEFRKMARDMKK